MAAPTKKHCRKSWVFLFVLAAFLYLASACGYATYKSYTYPLSTGGSVRVTLDTRDGYDIENQDGGFVVTDGTGKLAIYGRFESIDRFEEIKIEIEASDEISVVSEKADDIVYLAYAEAGWETDRAVRITELQCTVVMASTGIESKRSVEAYERLGFEVERPLDIQAEYEKRILGLPVMAFAAVVGALLAALAGAAIFAIRKRRSRFEYDFGLGDEDDKAKEDNSPMDKTADDGTRSMFLSGQGKQPAKMQDHAPRREAPLLVLERKGKPAEKFEIDTSAAVKIGRSSRLCGIAIKGDRYISRIHCQILSRNGEAIVEDAESVNGTWVNGEAVKGGRTLRTGDELRLGTHEFSVRVGRNE